MIFLIEWGGGGAVGGEKKGEWITSSVCVCVCVCGGGVGETCSLRKKTSGNSFYNTNKIGDGVESRWVLVNKG